MARGKKGEPVGLVTEATDRDAVKIVDARGIENLKVIPLK